MSAAIIAARKCVEWIASEEELGDLEEIGRATSQAYLREAVSICLSVLHRRLRRAITQGGVEMARIILWAALSVAGVLLFLSFGGGSALVYIQPFEWGVILAAMLGFAAAGRRLGAWPGILGDLRRAQRMTKADWLQRRSAYLREEGTSPDFAHLAGMLTLARQSAPAEADRMMNGGIALFRDKRRQRVAMIEQTVRDAYAGSFIALIFGLVHLLDNLQEPPDVLGHLLGGALCASFFGVILGRAVLAPIGSRLEVLYEQQAREMETLRLSLGSEVQAETFQALAACWS